MHWFKSVQNNNNDEDTCPNKLRRRNNNRYLPSTSEDFISHLRIFRFLKNKFQSIG